MSDALADFCIQTPRLRLRAWRTDDAHAFHAICMDPAVMQFLGGPMDMAEIDALIVRMQGLQTNLGHCFWAVEQKSDARLIGWCGLIRGAAHTPIANRVEIGWRLAADMWGQGFAREAADASIDWGFAHLDDPEIWAITVPKNKSSWGLMERLGMQRQHDKDFNHPNVAWDSPLLRHITYSIGKITWQQH
jgi:RimJ/RimL family protein N-acetyltransferase